MVVWTFVAAACTGLLASIQTLGKLAIITWVGFASIFTAVFIVVYVANLHPYLDMPLIFAPPVLASPWSTGRLPHLRKGHSIWRSLASDIPPLFLGLWRP